MTMLRLAWNLTWNAFPWLLVLGALVFFVAERVVEENLAPPVHWVQNEVLHLGETYSIDTPSISFTRDLAPGIDVVTVDWRIEMRESRTGARVCPVVTREGTLTPDEPRTHTFSIHDLWGRQCIPPPGEYYVFMTANYQRNGEVQTEPYNSNDRFLSLS